MGMRRGLLCGVGLLAAAPAQAAFLQLGGVALPGQGVVTTQPGAVEERFDGPGFPTISAFTFPIGAPGARTPGESVPNEHLAPRTDSAGYLAVGQANSFTSLDLPLNGDFRYIGFDWGSIDEYNVLRFLDSTGTPIFFENFGTQISGLALVEFFEVPLYSSLYIDFSFFRSPIPRQIQLISTTNAFEIDNLAFSAASIVPSGAVFNASLDAQFGDPAWASLPGRRPDPLAVVPAPAGVALFGLAAAALLGGRARRRG
jgi:hypothetical protein